ncbi:CoA-binding protein [Natronococcus jeotgali]|uniref:CoA-binding domain-containing protein n=1 Tax=Natronococcus jeotgali DSM 18795 TaxID=1227498 RepID=L9WVU1_9EURY|nr:CoA-binding protein [Natronococcus jeotgali]ELY52468.1 CoA-binding domain-containing protein [Natronococcus jeotgali DSM 18795]
MPVTEDDRLRKIFDNETIAVVGCSSTPGKAAHDVPNYLLERGYEIVPVNPTTEEVLGRPAADALSEVDREIDVVCIFRPSDEVAGIVDEVLEREDVDVVWTQLGISDDEAAASAEESGRTVVQDRCMKVEHGRLVG